jgi:glucose/mannose transport system permease protein
MSQRTSFPLVDRLASLRDGATGELSRSRLALYVTLFTMAGLFLLPLEAAMMTSLKTASGFANTLPFSPPPPDQTTLAGWIEAWDLLRSTIVNSAMFVIPAMVILPVLGSLAAFGLTITDWRGQLLIYTLFIIGIFIPLQAVLVPLAIIWQMVDLVGLLANLGPLNVWELPMTSRHQAEFIQLAITHISFGIPLATLLFRSHYKDLSDEMIEAARLEGVKMRTIYRQIILPLSKPVFVVVMILEFTTVWNDLLFALVIVSSPEARPVTVAFAGIASGKVQDFSIIMAAGFLTALPTLLVYIAFTKQFAEGFSQTGA